MATVSGPGSQPVRTLTDAAYGEQQTFRDIQQGAPMPQAGGAPAPAPQGGGGPSPIPLTEGSQLPDEPVTAGAPFGAGPGPTGPMNPDGRAEAASLQRYLPAIERVANQPDSSQTLRNLVQFLKGL